MERAVIALFLLVAAVSGKSLKDPSVPDVEKICEYNGQSYKLGDELPTRHLCLSCKCTDDFVEPSNVYCDVIQCQQTAHVEIGCVPVYNDSECCPVSWDCKNALTSKCDKRYFKHYEVKGCTPVYGEDQDCPIKYDCPDTSLLKETNNECIYKGKTYKLGDDIKMSNPCLMCRCGHRGDGVDIDCISAECPSVFRGPLNDSCYDVYEEGKCCAVRTDCSNNDGLQEAEKVCLYDGRTYKLGQKIYPKEDPCLICSCTENWTDIHGSGCRVHDCNLERKRKQIRQGCIPIYHEATCCPIEFYCGEDHSSASLHNASFSNVDIESGATCLFKGSHYAVGEILDIQHPTGCVTCSCRTPPDFTCVHKKCSGPPNDDYENCEPTYKRGQCCATYHCKEDAAQELLAAPAPQCSPVSCPAGCTEVTIHNSCPFCQCQKLLCAPPKCDAGCEAQKTAPEGQCPGCDCSDSKPHSPLCSPVKCPSHCYEVVSPMGCNMCVCGPLCSPPKCEEGCHLIRDVPAGECPTCSCPKHDDGAIQCSPVKCLPNCRESVGESGCPSCICELACSPPKCDEGCHVGPAAPGHCPECVCGEPRSASVLCSPVKCGPLCHEAFDGSGCPSCICDPSCSTPHCEEGCHLEHDPASGPCPHCACDTKHPPCPEITCGPGCSPEKSSDGCLTCQCQPICSAPHCGQGCHLEYDRTAGPCPACVCPNTITEIQCSPVHCEAGCVEATGDHGCQTCVCNPHCSTPQCDPGCKVSYSPEDGPCPTCKCQLRYRSPGRAGISCTTPKCDEGCHINYSSKPCPSCTCGTDGEVDLTGIQCSMPNCGPGCTIDYSTKPCPGCKCGNDASDLTGIQCSMPNCGVGCSIDYSTKPCPGCKCGNSQSDLSGIQCSPPNCGAGCSVDYSAKPCPGCKCGNNQLDLSGIQCSMPNCEVGCSIDYSSKPCPGCKCGNSQSDLTGIQCSTPNCGAGCSIDYSTKPCPGCKCGNSQSDLSGIQCSPPNCGAGCSVDYNAKPCPGCKCGNNQLDLTGIQCSMPNCGVGCSIDYSTKPCPGCKCGNNQLDLSGIQCSMPNCGEGCSIDYSTKPCPGCKCGNSQSGLSEIQCSMPRCAAGCQINYNAKPCPDCTCTGSNAAELTGSQCSMPNCGEGCHIDFSTKPCPSCSCSNIGAVDLTGIQCSMPKCDAGCHIDYSIKPCPGCSCSNKELPLIHCTPPQCTAGCSLDFSTKPCPSCKCENKSLEVPLAMCSQPKCDPNSCAIDYSTKPCPSCNCDPRLTAIVQCSPVKCDSHCLQVTDGHGCPSCQCPLCSIPRCRAGCSVNYNADPCPTCVCDRNLRNYPVLQYHVYTDPFCAKQKCGPGCEPQRTAADNQRCPGCVCNVGSGQRQVCPAMQCELPCRFERFSQYGCPSCICHPIPCSPLNCGPGLTEKKRPGDRCPTCRPIDT